MRKTKPTKAAAPTKAPKAFLSASGTRTEAIQAYERRLDALDAEIKEVRALRRSGQPVPANRLAEALTRERLLTWQMLDMARTMDGNEAVLKDARGDRAAGPWKASSPKAVAEFAKQRGGVGKYEAFLHDAAARFCVGTTTIARHLAEAKEKNLMS
jgi:hypothetical protein